MHRTGNTTTGSQQPAHNNRHPPSTAHNRVHRHEQQAPTRNFCAPGAHSKPAPPPASSSNRIIQTPVVTNHPARQASRRRDPEQSAGPQAPYPTVHNPMLTRRQACKAASVHAYSDDFIYMPRGTNVPLRHGIPYNAKQGLSYFCMGACFPLPKRLTRLSS